MCLIVLAWRVHPDRPLIVAANRDEFHARPASRAAFWRDHPSILAGRDLEAGGTWMGVSRSGRFAAVTNYKGGRDPDAKESRGSLVVNFLLNAFPPEKYISQITAKQNTFSGFNLLVADANELWWCSNRDGGTRRLEPGVYGLGNFFLDTPEVNEPKDRFRAAINPAPSIEPLFTVLGASQIVAPDYGTRCATVLLQGQDGIVSYAERPFAPDGTEGETLRVEFVIN